ncbi:MAG: CCDC90 family protein [Nitrospirae bacterium YQR-1]
MAASTFDTLKVFEILKSSGFSEEQAKGLSESIKVAQESSAESGATKGDIANLKAELEVKMESSKSDIIKWVAAMLIAQACLMAVMFRLLGLLK